MKKHRSTPGGRIPTAILMSGTGTNARKILEYVPSDSRLPAFDVRLILSDNPGSNYRRIAEEHRVEARLHDIYDFHGVDVRQGELDPEDREKLRDPSRRKRYDRGTDRILKKFKTAADGPAVLIAHTVKGKGLISSIATKRAAKRGPS